MEEGNIKQLHQPLLHTTTTQPLLHTTTTYSTVYGSSSSTSSATAGGGADDVSDCDSISSMIKHVLSNSGICIRLLFIIFVGVVCAWANYEALKGFDIIIANEASDTPLGKRFDLFYVSNDGISRLVFSTSKFVEGILYPNETYPKKQVNRVTVRLVSRNLNDPVTVDSPEVNEFVLAISPSVMEDDDFRHAMFSAVQQGMARVWLYDGQGEAPSGLVNGMAKYISSLNAVSGKILSAHSSGDAFCLKDRNMKKKKKKKMKDMDAIAMANFSSYSEEQKNGFIRELNQAMKDGWQDGIFDDALLGITAQHLCAN